MHISWLGHSAFKIETKTPLRDEVVILLNPYNFPRADLPRNLKSDLALLEQGEENTITLSGDPFIIKRNTGRMAICSLRSSLTIYCTPSALN